MTPRASWALATSVFVVVGLYAVYQGGFLAWHLFGFVVVLMGLGLVVRFSPLHKIRITRAVNPGPYYSGQSLHMTLAVSCSARWLWPYVTIEDKLPLEFGLTNPKFILHRLASEKTLLSYQILALNRGVWHWDQISLSSGDPFGLFRRSRTLTIPQRLVVWPEIVSLSTSQLGALFWQGANPSRHPARQHSTYLRGLREYVAGDRLSHVHWKASAHSGDFQVKQFEPETLPQFTIVLDWSSQFEPGEWEIAVSAAASLLSHAIQSGEAVGLVALDAPNCDFRPTTSPSVFAAMMDFLSALRHQATPGNLGSADLTEKSRRVIVTAATTAHVWQNPTDRVIAIGDGALQNLGHLPQYLDRTTAMKRGPS
jgi:uncharacterized protein (DUF58 family)